MAFTTLSLTFTEEVARLALTTRRGALPPDFWRELNAALKQLRGARALIVTGGGPDFSVGLDLKATAPVIADLMPRPGAFVGLVREMQAAVEALANLPIVTIAALSGWCIGAGLELACACDLRLASQDVRLSLPEVKLGLVADLGGLQRLPRLIGEGPARWLALTGEPLPAPDALRLGLVGEVLDTPEALQARALDLARTVGAYPARAMMGTKRVLNERLPHTDGLALAARWNAEHLDLNALAGALKPSRAAEPEVLDAAPSEASTPTQPAAVPAPSIGRHAGSPTPPSKEPS